MNSQKILFIFTRTPLHVGAGSSVGAIDQPVQRERHTGFPIIPASSMKGSFADLWNDSLVLGKKNGKASRSRVLDNAQRTDAAWLFGSDNDKHPFAGALQFSEAKLLAFPIRSAKGSFAWITCPLMLDRAVRDGVLTAGLLDKLEEPKDGEAIFDVGNKSDLAIGSKIVLEEYTFEIPSKSWLGLDKLAKGFACLFDEDPLWKAVKSRLVIMSNGMMSYFAQNACEIAQHVRISDETGAAEPGGLFNQENVPGETLFYSVLRAFDERGGIQDENRRDGNQALEEFAKKVSGQVSQFGGDASTGLGYCSLSLKPLANEGGA
jgi:CRISPR-associated protein Cmr4